jgi:hypothetical protein
MSSRWLFRWQGNPVMHPCRSRGTFHFILHLFSSCSRRLRAPKLRVRPRAGCVWQLRRSSGWSYHCFWLSVRWSHREDVRLGVHSPASGGSRLKATVRTILLVCLFLFDTPSILREVRVISVAAHSSTLVPTVATNPGCVGLHFVRSTGNSPLVPSRRKVSCWHILQSGFDLSGWHAGQGFIIQEHPGIRTLNRRLGSFFFSPLK